MPPAGFEPTIPVSERPQINAFDGAATGIGTYIYIYIYIYLFIFIFIYLLCYVIVKSVNDVTLSNYRSRGKNATVEMCS